MKLISHIYSQDSTTTIQASSQNVLFPASNIRSPIRAKEWRSSGYFKITSSNNTFELNEGSGFVAGSITEGTYTAQSLAQEIKTQLESTGSNSYDVTYSKTEGLWTITSDDTFDIVGSFPPVIGFTQDLSGSETEYTGASIAIHTEEHIIFDLKTTEPIDTIALLWSSGDYRLSDAAVITLEAHSVNNWDSPSFSQTLTFDNRNEIAQAHFASESYRYWRLKIVDPENVHLYVSLGVVVLGKADEVITWTSNGFTCGFRDLTKIQETDFGQSYADLAPKLKSMSMNFDVLSNEEQEALISLFQKVGVGKQIFVSLDPNESRLLSDYFIYGRLNSPLGMRHQSLSYFSTSLEIVETN